MNNDKLMNFEINSFIIFDPSISTSDDEEHKKILYCYPKTVPLEQRMKTIGLCEAMCNFAREFTDSACQFIHTQKTRIIMQNMNNEMSFIMTVNIPKKSATSEEYLEEEVQNSICEIILHHCRDMFFLFMGPPSYIIEKDGHAVLIEKLEKFFDRYIGNGMLDGYQITDGLPGVQLLPTDKDMYSEAEILITRLEAKFPDIISSLLLFNNSLVYSTVDKEDLGILYRYLTTTLLAKYNFNDAINSSFTSFNMGKFIVGPIDLSMKSSSNQQKVFLKTKKYLAKTISAPKEVSVIVYKALQASVVFFVDKNSTSINDYFKDIHTYLGPELTKLTNTLKLRYENISESPYRYLYWNPETLSVKCTLFPTRQWRSDFPPLVPIETMKLMADMKQEHDRHDKLNNKSIKEMAVKLHSDSWVICIENNGRQLFVVINKRNFSLVDVSKEMKHLCGRDFPKVFKLDMD